MNATLEKFQGATLSLTRSGHIKERLTEAYRNYLAFVVEDELPSELREEFRAFSLALTRERRRPGIDLRGEDAVRATVRKMSCDEAEKVASSVVRMFAAVSGSLASGTRSKGPTREVRAA